MGHKIRAIIGKKKIITKIADDWVYAGTTDLPQEYSMLFLTQALFDDIIELYEDKYETEYQELTYLVTPVIQLLQDYSFHTQLVYVETDYYWGYGSQAGVLFENGKITDGPLTGDGTINQLLSSIGVWKERGKDEFDSLALWKYRKMPQ